MSGVPQPPTRRGPAMGALDGVRRDLKAAKEAEKKGDLSDPNSVGAAWTHNFLNQKPWHPMNFRNQARVWEAEQAKYEEEKKKAEAKAEFEAEQEYLQTLSMLSAEEQEKYRQRQSVSFLYMKPPGYDASLERLEQANRDGTAKPSTLPASGGASSSQAGFTPPPGPLGKGATAGTTSQAGPGPSGQTPGQGPGGGGLGANYLAKMLEGYRAAKGDKFELKGGGAEMGRSPPRGGVDAGAANQQFVIAEVDSEEEERALREAGMTDAERRAAAKQVAREARAAQKAADRSELERAKDVLRAAGIEVPDSDGSSSDEERRERSKSHKKKSKKKKRRK
uniref:CBF1-interacting co-repressor CIR N-terminal domain-containing protein n=1 Tax=Auxenochlorella protothecoides TaxID=3075 RepID=A0A1D2A8P4_AUXPR